MGINANIAMPLISTLAALVIIVHTAEENYDRDYREITPRLLEVEPPNYDQSWRVVDEPAIKQNIHPNEDRWVNDGPDQRIRRRRRKRKRKPPVSNEDEMQIHDGDTFSIEPLASQHDSIEITRGHRNRANDKEIVRPVHWSQEIRNKPLKRRGQKIKRPVIVDSWPELSEFNRHQEEQPEREEVIGQQLGISDGYKNQKNIELQEEEQQHSDQDEQNVEQTGLVNINSENIGSDTPLQKDRFLSEFSSELVQTAQTSTSNQPAKKIIYKKTNTTNLVNDTQDTQPLDPSTLKALLKKSKGKSLSEILQQNNLSLSDLLHGKAKALSILGTNDEPQTNQYITQKNLVTTTTTRKMENTEGEQPNKQEDSDNNDCTTKNNEINNDNTSEDDLKENTSKNSVVSENTTRGYLRRRFPTGNRRRLRMKPNNTTTQRPSTNMDLINVASVKYKNNRHINKTKEWKEVVSAMLRRRPPTKEVIKLEPKLELDKITTTTVMFEETTIEDLFEATTDSSFLSTNIETTIYQDNMENLHSADSKRSHTLSEMSPPTTEAIATYYNEESTTEKIVSEKPILFPILRPVVNSSELRRQAYNNRLKRKRLKQKVATAENHEIQEVFGTSNFVSASQFIEKAQTKVTKTDSESYTLEDFMTTEPSPVIQLTESANNILETTKINLLGMTTEDMSTSTEDSAKFEIEEILNDNLTSARFSKILQDRNMTLSELVELRERGSSHVHLADIFHNASKEPNPPEPFLSKSLIEPISKETYPLRALLEANLHDPKTTIGDSISVKNHNLNISLVMDFGNNVNENGENIGIISLFNNFSKTDNEFDTQNNNDKDQTAEVNDNEYKQETATESRALKNKDAMTWNDLINLIQKNHQEVNDSTIETDNLPTYDDLNIRQDKELDGDLVVLEDLQNFTVLDSRPIFEELLELKLYDNNEISTEESPFSTTTKSVTVATVTIVGLALILFLLTYAALKWKQQSKVYHNRCAKDCMPSPVFDNRKSLKTNSSTRSKSLMLSSNIYAIDSLDPHAGNESPEYMFDTLRKPFQ